VSRGRSDQRPSTSLAYEQEAQLWRTRRQVEEGESGAEGGEDRGDGRSLLDDHAGSGLAEISVVIHDRCHGCPWWTPGIGRRSTRRRSGPILELPVCVSPLAERRNDLGCAKGVDAGSCRLPVRANWCAWCVCASGSSRSDGSDRSDWSDGRDWSDRRCWSSRGTGATGETGTTKEPRTRPKDSRWTPTYLLLPVDRSLLARARPLCRSRSRPWAPVDARWPVDCDKEAS
jgi:hypothetical protein